VNPTLHAVVQLAAARAWTRRPLAKAGTTELHSWLQRRIDEAQAFDIADYTTLPGITTRREPRL
jgi:hypothetical protein